MEAMDLRDMITEGDCLEVMDHIADHSIDLVLCDLPYGTTNNRWDTMIDLERLWAHYKRVVKPSGVIALTGQHAFTARLIMSNLAWFKYKIVWIKSKATNFLNATKQPLRRHEDICVFYQRQPFYQPQKSKGVPYDKGVRKGNNGDSYGMFNAAKIINTSGERFPNDVLFYEEDVDWLYFKTAEHEGVYHPTQKPVSLGRWLIRTYTRPGQIVLDNACGSGSFLVAAIQEGRHFIGIEKNHDAFHHGKAVDYVAISRQRIADAFTEMSKSGLLNEEQF